MSTVKGLRFGAIHILTTHPDDYKLVKAELSTLRKTYASNVVDSFVGQKSENTSPAALDMTYLRVADGFNKAVVSKLANLPYKHPHQLASVAAPVIASPERFEKLPLDVQEAIALNEEQLWASLKNRPICADNLRKTKDVCGH